MALTCNVPGRAATIAATATVNTLALDYARRWRLTIKNTHGSQTLTVCRLRRRTHRAGPWSEWVAVASGLPVAAGATLTITPDGDDCAEDLDVELTASGAGTGVEFWLAGAQ
jgi:hypothetical protein